MKILIATGIYPPDIGGPAQYAKNLAEVWEREGHSVSVDVFPRGRKLPSGVRHFYYFLRLLPKAFRADFIFSPDTFSAAVPAVFVAKLLRKKILIRTGGDFLWEEYVERTGDLVLLRNFYKSRMDKFSLKEKIIFFLTRFVLRHADGIIFSTKWQRDIFTPAYRIDLDKTAIVENYYGPKINSFSSNSKNFIAGTRPLKWKNSVRIAEAFRQVGTEAKAVYDNHTFPHDKFIDAVTHSYGVIIASLGDVSPNTILDAIRANKPFILTRETGFYEKLKDVALFVDPEDVSDIAKKIALLCDPAVYETYKNKVARFGFTHSWEEIAKEIILIFKSL